MNGSTGMDWDLVAKEVALPVEAVRRTIELLDAGNTIPFVARFRRDQTGGLDEEQIRRAHAQVIRLRGLAERKQTILKSIESHGKLTPELAQQIQSANSPKRLEDLYLPYKPRKQTLAAVARERGLEPLADDVLSGKLPHDQLDEVVASLVRPEKGLHNAQDVMQGVAAIIAEGYGERADLRSRLRKIMHRTGKLVCMRVETNPLPSTTSPSQPAPAIEQATATGTSTSEEVSPSAEQSPALTGSELGAAEATPLESTHPEPNSLEAAPDDANPSEATSVAIEAAADSSDSPATGEQLAPVDSEVVETASGESAISETAITETTPAEEAPAEVAAPEGGAAESAATLEQTPAAKKQPKPPRKKKKPTHQEKKQRALENSFKDYFDHQEPIQQAPPHRVLAINRGERAKVLRVRIEADAGGDAARAEALVVPAEHPHAEFLQACVRDALQRLVRRAWSARPAAS